MSQVSLAVLGRRFEDDFNQYGTGTFGHWRFEWNLNLVYTNPYDKVGSALVYAAAGMQLRQGRQGCNNNPKPPPTYFRRG